jgi:hypothetical protein
MCDRRGVRDNSKMHTMKKRRECVREEELETIPKCTP